MFTDDSCDAQYAQPDRGGSDRLLAWQPVLASAGREDHRSSVRWGWTRVPPGARIAHRRRHWHQWIRTRLHVHDHR